MTNGFNDSRAKLCLENDSTAPPYKLEPQKIEKDFEALGLKINSPGC